MTQSITLNKTAAVLVAAALTLAAPLSPAFAQGYGRSDAQTRNAAGSRVETQVHESRSFFGMPAWVLENQGPDTVTTGSTNVDRSTRDGRHR